MTILHEQYQSTVGDDVRGCGIAWFSQPAKVHMRTQWSSHAQPVGDTCGPHLAPWVPHGPHVSPMQPHGTKPWTQGAVAMTLVSGARGPALAQGAMTPEQGQWSLGPKGPKCRPNLAQNLPHKGPRGPKGSQGLSQGIWVAEPPRFRGVREGAKPPRPLGPLGPKWSAMGWPLSGL